MVICILKRFVWFELANFVMHDTQFAKYNSVILFIRGKCGAIKKQAATKSFVMNFLFPSRYLLTEFLKNLSGKSVRQVTTTTASNVTHVTQDLFNKH